VDCTLARKSASGIRSARMEATGECQIHQVLCDSEGHESVPGKCWNACTAELDIGMCILVTVEIAAEGGGMVMVVDSNWMLELLLLGYKLEYMWHLCTSHCCFVLTG
jgi:hypothetical protein